MRVHDRPRNAPADELVALLAEVGARTKVDVRRFPGSRRNPQFNREALATTLADAGVEYVHSPELGGRRSGEHGEERFGCIREAALRSYAARMGRRSGRRRSPLRWLSPIRASCAPRRCARAATGD